MRDKQIYFIYKVDKVEFETSCIGIKEVAEYLKRPLESVYVSMSILRHKKAKDFILKDYEGNKHLILSELELKTGKWYSNKKKRG